MLTSDFACSTTQTKIKNQHTIMNFHSTFRTCACHFCSAPEISKTQNTASISLKINFCCFFQQKSINPSNKTLSYQKLCPGTFLLTSIFIICRFQRTRFFAKLLSPTHSLLFFSEVLFFSHFCFKMKSNAIFNTKITTLLIERTKPALSENNL